MAEKPATYKSYSCFAISQDCNEGLEPIYPEVALWCISLLRLLGKAPPRFASRIAELSEAAETRADSATIQMIAGHGACMPLGTLELDTLPEAMGMGRYIGRLAPSPTGLLHLGHVRTFAVAHGRARAARGVLRLRMDDLDPQRSRAEYVAAAEEDLRWLGLGWHGEPWRQSERGPAYRTAWQRLVEAGWVYPCRCSRRDLAEAVAAPHEGLGSPVSGSRAHGERVGIGAGASGGVAETEEPVYPGRCRPAWLPDSADGAEERASWLRKGPDGVNWRFRVPDGEPLTWEDGGAGARQEFVAGKSFGDFSVWRRDGIPAYQLATVVDDAAMSVTEVVRGADLLLSTARQLLLWRALGLPAEPAWFHCQLVVNEHGERLAKRAEAASVRGLREQGFSAAEVLRMAEQAQVG